MQSSTRRWVGRFDVLVLSALVWFLGKFVRYAFPPLFGTLGDGYGVSRTLLGTAFTGFMLIYALLQFPSGLLADRYGAVRVIVGGSLLTAVGALATLVDAPFVVLAGAMLAMGAGTGTYKTVAVRLLARTYPSQTGRVLGVFDTFGTFGGVAAPAAIVLVASRPVVFGAPWRLVFLGAAIGSVLLAIAFALRVSDRDSTTSHDDSTASTPADNSDAGHEGTGTADAVDVRTYIGMFRRPTFTGFVLVTILFGFAYNGTVAFLPLYLTSETTLSSVTANLLFSALFVVSVVQLLTGEASDRVGTPPILVLTLAAATAGLLAILAVSDTGGPLLLGAAVLTLGIGAHGFRPVRGAYLMDIVPDAVAGGSFGIVRTLLMGAGAIAPAIVGYLSETAGFRPAFSLLAGSLLGATGLMVVLWIADRS
ncbi:MAG: MFS transporter [Halanaeroarchaeum sp.]